MTKLMELSVLRRLVVLFFVSRFNVDTRSPNLLRALLWDARNARPVVESLRQTVPSRRTPWDVVRFWGFCCVADTLPVLAFPRVARCEADENTTRSGCSGAFMRSKRRTGSLFRRPTGRGRKRGRRAPYGGTDYPATLRRLGQHVMRYLKEDTGVGFMS